MGSSRQSQKIGLLARGLENGLGDAVHGVGTGFGRGLTANPLVAAQQLDEQGNTDANGLYQLTTVVTAPAAPIATLAREVAVTVSWNRQWGGNRQITLTTITQGNGV